MRQLLNISTIMFTILFLISCSSESITAVSERPKPGPGKASSNFAVAQSATGSNIFSTLAQVKRATSGYHNVNVAKRSGYVQVSAFVPGMGYHYLNARLLDAEVNPAQPEALVYVDNPADENKRRLVAVEYIIPFGIIDQNSQSALDDKFPGIDGDHWHKESEIGAWTLHAWIWYDNPEGAFHPHNPRVGQSG